MATKAVQIVTNPKTSPPDKNKPYIPLLVDGKEVWYLLQADEADLEPGDFDFAKGKKWAREQRKKERENGGK